MTALRPKAPNLYELALLLADAQTRVQKEYRWEDFIDNLARICDEFAYSVHPKEKPRFPAFQEIPVAVPQVAYHAVQTASAML